MNVCCAPPPPPPTTSNPPVIVVAAVDVDVVVTTGSVLLLISLVHSFSHSLSVVCRPSERPKREREKKGKGISALLRELN